MTEPTADAKPAEPERDACAEGGFLATSLMKAATQGSVLMVEKALECTATNLDAISADGRTAVMIAALNGHAAVCRALAEAGCDLEARDCDGKRAVDLAADAACRDALADEQRKRDLLWSAISGEAAAEQDPEAQLRAMLASAKLGGGLSAESPF